MPALQVRDFPDDLYEQLKERAREEHRSIAQQTIVCVEDYLSRPRMPAWQYAPAPTSRLINLTDERGDRKPAWMHHELPPEQVEERKRLFAEMLQRPKFDVPEDFPAPEELIREDRDSRWSFSTPAQR